MIAAYKQAKKTTVFAVDELVLRARHRTALGE